MNQGAKFKNKLGMEFVYIKSGKFTMGGGETPKALVKRFGGKENYFKTEKNHDVTLSESFWLQTKEVTKKKKKKFVEDTGYKTDAEKNDGGYGWDG